MALEEDSYSHFNLFLHQTAALASKLSEVSYIQRTVKRKGNTLTLELLCLHKAVPCTPGVPPPLSGAEGGLW